MEWYEILILIIGIFVVINFFYHLLRNRKYKKLISMINTVIEKHMKNSKVIIHNNNMLYNIEVVNTKRYLIKILNINPQHEIIITNSEKVVINHDIKGWKKSTNPNFVPGIKEYMKLDTSKSVFKIVLIYPNCHNITKYINESDVYKVNKFQKVDGLYFVKFDELGEFFEKH